MKQWVCACNCDGLEVHMRELLGQYDSGANAPLADDGDALEWLLDEVDRLRAQRGTVGALYDCGPGDNFVCIVCEGKGVTEDTVAHTDRCPDKQEKQ